ncbi:cytosolic invertase 1-like [Prunus yedoensis var. nudiflora]|uniref:Cytosolic invertase 1-like n=1 Tax=Prunus yedoensis var. nudiflora TaxID=2094558 RepID=A0A314UFB0_PRUYE|nr:cytosolic invertase 1-like [Prunus yedoensis var. nudiflora]
MIENPANLSLISLEEDKKIAKPRLIRSASFLVKPVAAAYIMHYRPRPSSSDLNKCQSLYFYSLAADYGFEPNALDPIKRATESAEGCVKDFIFG